MKACTSPGGCRLALLSLSLLLPIPPTATPHPRPPAAGSMGPRSTSFAFSSHLSSGSSREVWGEQPRAVLGMRFPSRQAREDGAMGGGGGGSRSGEALNSILGELQSTGREKGGFGFRFGRNSAFRGG
ncbi:uncharacterized protein qrfp [Stigmatopora nigra]